MHGLWLFATKYKIYLSVWTKLHSLTNSISTGFFRWNQDVISRKAD